MSEQEEIDTEPADSLCALCCKPKPRLIFDQLSRFLLCEPCLERVQQQLAWTLLRQDETA